MVGLDAAEHGLDGGGEAQTFEPAGDRDQGLTSARAAGVAGTIEPGARIECADDCAKHIEVGMREGVLDEFQRAMKATAVGPHLRKGFRVARGGGTDALQRVGAPADLLKDCIVGNGAKFARVTDDDGACHTVCLTGGGTRTGAVNQRWAEGAEQGGVTSILDEVLHAGADGGEEIGCEIGIGVDRILDRAGCRMERVFGDAGDGCECKLFGGEEEVTVAALEGAFLTDLEIGFEQGLTAGSGGEVFEAFGEGCGVGTATDAFATRVEEDDFDVLDFEARERLGDFETQTLDQIAGGGLADVAARIRIAELQSEAARCGEIVAIMRTAQCLFQNVGALLERTCCFEERADFDVVFHTKQARKIKRREQRVAGLGFGDEEADGRGAVHMLLDLRDHHHQAGGGGLFGDEATEIDGIGCDGVEGGVDGAEYGATVGWVLDRVGNVEALTDGVVDLSRIQSDMGVGEGEAVRNKARPSNAKGELVVG